MLRRGSGDRFVGLWEKRALIWWNAVVLDLDFDSCVVAVKSLIATFEVLAT